MEIFGLQVIDGNVQIIPLKNGGDKHIGVNNDGQIQWMPDNHYYHIQESGTTTWIIEHNLGKKPLIEIFVNEQLVGAEVIQVNDNISHVVFSQPQVGYAICKI